MGKVAFQDGFVFLHSEPTACGLDHVQLSGLPWPNENTISMEAFEHDGGA